MKKKHKNMVIYILLSIFVLVIAGLIFVYNFTKPIQIQHVFQYGVSVKDSNIIDKDIQIELKGFISKTDFKLSNMALRRDLKGTITIDGKEYNLDLVNFGDATSNLFWGSVSEIGSHAKPTYMAFVTNDLSTIYLSQDTDKYHIAAPAKTIDDYNNIKTIMLS